MEPEFPEWLDKTFLEQVLQCDEENKVNVVKFSAKPAVPAGNNYTSHLYRVRVEYKVSESGEESTSLIVKAPITKGVITELGEKVNFYCTEPKVYSELLPIMSRKADFEFGPKPYYCPVKNGLVLRDMREEGYLMSDRFKQLDFSHCRIVIKTLARFHAASVACHHDSPDLIEEIGKERMYTEDGFLEGEMKSWMQSCLKTVGGIARKTEGCEAFADLVLSKDCIMESISNLCRPKVSGLNVLNHGDLWVNNILFKYNDSGEIVDIKLIDFQLTRYASPVMDLTYFIWSSANEEVRGSRQEDLYEIYLRTLNKNLELLGCEERMSAEELREDLKAATDWVIITICNLLPFILCAAEDVLNMEEMHKDDFKNDKVDEKFHKIYNGKHFRTILPIIIQQFQTWLSSQ